MTRRIAATLVAIMLLAQIGIAQHNLVHFVEHTHDTHVQKAHSHTSPAHQDQKNHKKNVSEACQTCLMIKSLNMALVTNAVNIAVPTFLRTSDTSRDIQITDKTQIGFYNPRAPPFFLI